MSVCETTVRLLWQIYKNFNIEFCPCLQGSFICLFPNVFAYMRICVGGSVCQVSQGQGKGTAKCNFLTSNSRDPCVQN